MNAAEFQAVLNTVEQDHQFVLDKVQALKYAVDYLMQPGETAPREALVKLRELNSYFCTQFVCHLDEEEETLFPFLREHAPGGAELVARLRAEHDELRRKLGQFGNCLDVGSQLEEHPPKQVLRDLLAYGFDLWEVLDRHAHDETVAVHQCLGTMLK